MITRQGFLLIKKIYGIFSSTILQSIYFSMVNVLNILTKRQETFINWKPPFLVHRFEICIEMYFLNNYIS